MHRRRRDKTVLIVGDSLVEGVGARRKKGWAQKIFADRDDLAILVSGVGGSTVRDVLARAGRYRAKTISLAIVQVGINDSRVRLDEGSANEVPIDEFARVLEQLAQLLATFCKRVAFTTLTRVDEARTSPYKDDKQYGNVDIARYESEIRRVAAEQGVDVVEVPPLADVPGLLADGLHPSSPGHEILRQAISTQVEQWI